jgi:phosphohistidine swiveling domain-containing protein
MGDERDPRAIERLRALERARADRELFGSLGAPRREAARAVAKLAARFIPLRGTGKAAFLQCVDVARAAAMVIGEELADAGSIERPADAFMLTVPELLAPAPPADAGELAAARRAIHDEYRGLDIPDLFTGAPQPFAIDRDPADGERAELVTGAAVSPGVVEGVARVVLDADVDEPIEPGEILVCRTTDPSWASTMMLAAALVIDIGGPISHGAIVARELGIPCVIGTRNGTAVIRTGDTLVVDGGRGEVQIRTRATKESVIA